MGATKHIKQTKISISPKDFFPAALIKAAEDLYYRERHPAHSENVTSHSYEIGLNNGISGNCLDIETLLTNNVEIEKETGQIHFNALYFSNLMGKEGLSPFSPQVLVAELKYAITEIIQYIAREGEAQIDEALQKKDIQVIIKFQKASDALTLRHLESRLKSSDCHVPEHDAPEDSNRLQYLADLMESKTRFGQMLARATAVGISSDKAQGI